MSMGEKLDYCLICMIDGYERRIMRRYKERLNFEEI